MIYTQDGFVFSLSKEGKSDIYYSVGEPERHDAEGSEPVTEGQILYDATYLRNLEKSDSEREVEWWEGVYCWVGTEFSLER